MPVNLWESPDFGKIVEVLIACTKGVSLFLSYETKETICIDENRVNAEHHCDFSKSKKIFSEVSKTSLIAIINNTHFVILTGPYKCELICIEKPALIFLVSVKFVNRPL